MSEKPVRDKVVDGRAIPPFIMIERSLLGTLTPNVLAVYCALLRFANHRSRECWPCHETLANLSLTSVSTVKRAIGALQSGGLVHVKRITTAKGKSNRYTLLSPVNVKAKKRTKTQSQSQSSNRAEASPHRADGQFTESQEVYPTKETKRTISKVKQGTTDVVRSTQEEDSNILSTTDFLWAESFLDEISIEWREGTKQDSARIRSLWALTSGERAKRRQRFAEAIAEAENHATAPAGLFYLAMKALRGESFAGAA